MPRGMHHRCRLLRARLQIRNRSRRRGKPTPARGRCARARCGCWPLSWRAFPPPVTTAPTGRASLLRLRRCCRGSSLRFAPSQIVISNQGGSKSRCYYHRPCQLRFFAAIAPPTAAACGFVPLHFFISSFFFLLLYIRLSAIPYQPCFFIHLAI
jgi:hypothetical protein